MQVNAEQCNGCGACVEACPSGAIHMNAGLAIIYQAACVQCQVCVDACPQGAITSTEISIAAATPVVVQPVREAEIMVAESVPSKLKPWLISALAFTAREILPRLGDALIAALDRRLAQTQPANSQACQPSQNAKLLSKQDGRGHRRRGRPGQAHLRGRGQGDQRLIDPAVEFGSPSWAWTRAWQWKDKLVMKVEIQTKGGDWYATR